MTARSYYLDDVFRNKVERDTLQKGVAAINEALTEYPDAWERVGAGLLKRAYRFLDRRNMFVDNLTDDERAISKLVFNWMNITKLSGYTGEWYAAQMTEMAANHPSWVALERAV